MKIKIEGRQTRLNTTNENIDIISYFIYHRNEWCHLGSDVVHNRYFDEPILIWLASHLNSWSREVSSVESCESEDYECECCGYQTTTTWNIYFEQLDVKFTCYYDTHFGSSQNMGIADLIDAFNAVGWSIETDFDEDFYWY